MKNENVWKTYGEKELQELHAVNEKYKKCLDAGKTERECVTLAIKMAEEAGYRDVKEVLAAGKPLVCGDKVYANYMGKALALLRMGEKPISAGMNILGAHIDSPRIDIKQNPLYENEEFAYLDTHYYGGIKKYQWVAGPMALHGVVAKKDGTIVEIVIGEKEEDPVLVITDLLIHLAKEQLERRRALSLRVKDWMSSSATDRSRTLIKTKKKRSRQIFCSCSRKATTSKKRTSCLQSWSSFRQAKPETAVWIAAWCSPTGRMTECALSPLFSRCWR